MARWPSSDRFHRTSGMDWIWRATRAAIYLRDGMCCASCTARNALSLHHIDGPEDVPENLVTLCMACNLWIGEGDASSELKKVFARLVRKPLDREAGRALAKKLWPAWAERTSWKARVASQKRRKAA